MTLDQITEVQQNLEYISEVQIRFHKIINPSAGFAGNRCVYINLYSFCKKFYHIYTPTQFPSTLSSLPHINPIALRKAKIVYNFGLSECNRIKRIMGTPSRD